MSDSGLCDSKVETGTQPTVRQYRSPRLVIYGPVRDLTAGGTGKANENAGNTKERP